MFENKIYADRARMANKNITTKVDVVRTNHITMFAPFTVVSVLVALSCYVHSIPFFDKKEYVIIFEKFELVEQNPGNMVMISLKMSKYNRTTTVLNGLFQFLKNITESVRIDIIGYELHGVEYRKSVLDMKNMSYCDHLSNSISSASSGFLAYTNITHTSCPIPAGTYYIENFALDRLYYPPIFIGHKWRADIVLHQRGILWSHNRIYFKVENK